MVALPARHGVAQTAAVNEAIVRTKTMKVICEDGLTIDCTEFKAIDTGIVLIGGEDESGAVGYVPNERLVYVLPDDVVALEHDRLGVPAPEISSADELESRLGTFLDEIEILRESLDRQVEDLIGEGEPTDEEDVERQDRLYERRRTIDRALDQVRKRAQQFQQLSLAEFGSEAQAPVGAGADEADGMGAEEPVGEPSPRTEGPVDPTVNDRISQIEQQLETLLQATPTAAEGKVSSSDAEAEGEASAEAVAAAPHEVEAEPDPAEQDIDGISGLGPTYHDRLQAAGIDTLGSLADSDPTDVAEAANVTESKAQDWIDQANELAREHRAET